MEMSANIYRGINSIENSLQSRLVVLLWSFEAVVTKLEGGKVWWSLWCVCILEAR